MRIGKLAGSKQVLGVIAAAILLTIIFVPFQTVQAFTLDFEIPSTFNQSTTGEEFTLTLTIEPNEFISLLFTDVSADCNRESA